MRRGLRWPVAVAVFALCAQTALGQEAARNPSPTFLVKESGWTVFAGERSCDAVNRPLEEFNVAPVDALWLTRFAGQDHTALRVFYWPGAFKDDEAITLKIEFDGEAREYTAMTTGDYIVDLDHALPAEDIEAMDRAGQVTIGSDKVGDIAFLTQGFRKAAENVATCAARIAKK